MDGLKKQLYYLYAAALGISFVNRFALFLLLGALALYSYILYYLSTKKDYFSEG